MTVIQLHQEEKETIQLAIDHNRFAQQKLFERYSPKMLGVCRQYVNDLQQAEDVMISSFMKLFVNLKSFENKGSFEGWIRKIMINECISFLRVRKKVVFIEDQNVLTAESYNEAESQLSLDEIQTLIDDLPEGYKVVFNLYVIEGYKHKEIAEILGVNEGTSKSQLSHARRILQQKIGQFSQFKIK